jgi:glycosyltransferase involved in cell wall biosynthesis
LRIFEWLAVRCADSLIATNESQRRVQIERCGAEAGRCFIVRNGPNERFLEDVEPIASLGADERLKVGFVGIMGIQDGVDRFINALAILKQHRDDFLGVIVGNGPALESLKQLVAERELGAHFLFTGLVPYADVPRYIAACDICVTPDPSNSYNDSCTTIKTMEYMALRRPTVSFETAENRITAGESALYARDNDVSHFAELIEQLMDDATLRTKLGAVGRQRVESMFTWDQQKAQLIELYQRLFPAASLMQKHSHEQVVAEHSSDAENQTTAIVR